MMKIIKYSGKHFDTASKLLESCYREEVGVRFLKENCTVLGFVDERLVGLAGFGRSDLHNSIVNEYVCVDEDFRRNGYATTLHQTLLELFPLGPTDVALDISCYEGEIAEENFILNLGFTKFLDCHLCTFDLNKVIEPVLDREVVSLSSFYNSNTKSIVKKYYIERYNQEHEQFMPVTEDKSVWDDYYDDGSDFELGAVLVRNTEIMGCSFMHKDIFEDKSVVCINGYATGESVQQEAENLMALYNYQVLKLKASGLNKVYIEVDSTERVSNHILDWVPIDSRKVYKRYQLRK